jgi:hypothetical protein
MTEQAAESVEQVLRDELVRGDAVIASARPILRHLLTSDDSGLFSDEMIARIRGMVLDIARQLLLAQAAADDARDRMVYVASRQDDLARALLADTALVAHTHALTFEAHLVEQLYERSGIDPVLTPLVEDLAGAQDPGSAGLAMAALAAQARFQQHCRRMELPLGELPGELFHRVLVVMRERAGLDDGPAAERGEAQLRKGYDEASGRLGLIARLITGLGPGARRALAVDHAGLAIFATALSIATGQERDLVILSLAEAQGARFALSLRAAGLDQRSAVEQLLHFRSGISLPGGFEQLGSDRAVALLVASLPGWDA